MAEMKQRLQSDLTESIRSRDEVRSATLRMALAAITNEEVSGKEARVLSDDEITVVLGREAKKRRESVEAYTAANRPELADRERAELAVLAGYLPQPLDEEELAAMIAAAVTEAQSQGVVMKTLQPQVAGRADGAAVAAAVRAQLGA